MKHIKRGLVLMVFIFAAGQWGEAIWIMCKAQIAQHLIASAWQTTLQDKSPSRPWSWADVWPVARLQWLPNKENSNNEIDEDLYVLSGAHGEALAFGPGHLHGTAVPGTGLSVIAGHRDTHFDFLEQVDKGDILKIQTDNGTWVSYKIQSSEIRHIDRDPLLIDENKKGLLLITCYPFNSLITNGPYRYIVWASLIHPSTKTGPKNQEVEYVAKQQLVYENTKSVSF